MCHKSEKVKALLVMRKHIQVLVVLRISPLTFLAPDYQGYGLSLSLSVCVFVVLCVCGVCVFFCMRLTKSSCVHDTVFYPRSGCLLAVSLYAPFLGNQTRCRDDHGCTPGRSYGERHLFRSLCHADRLGQTGAEMQQLTSMSRSPSNYSERTGDAPRIGLNQTIRASIMSILRVERRAKPGMVLSGKRRCAGQWCGAEADRR